MNECGIYCVRLVINCRQVYGFNVQIFVKSEYKCRYICRNISMYKGKKQVYGSLGPCTLVGCDCSILLTTRVMVCVSCMCGSTDNNFRAPAQQATSCSAVSIKSQK